MLQRTSFRKKTLIGIGLVVAFLIMSNVGWGESLEIKEKSSQRNATSRIFDATLKSEPRSVKGIDNADDIIFQIIQKGNNLNYNAGSIKHPDWQVSNPSFIWKGGFFVSQEGRHKIKLPVKLKPTSRVLFEVGRHNFKTTPNRLIYFDKQSERFKELGCLKESDGVMAGSVVTYKNPFTSISCDLRYTNARSFFKQDMVMKALPPSPKEHGLDPDSTVIVILTQIDDFDEYLSGGIKAFRCGRKIDRTLSSSGFSQSEDGSIVFYDNGRGNQSFLHSLDRGIAYQATDGNAKIDPIPVKKKIWKDGSSTYLWEEVPWTYLEKAKYPVVIDYINRSGTLSSDETWTAGPMYLLEGELTLADGVTLTIDPGSVIKVQDDGGFSGIQVTGDDAKLIAAGTARAPITFTSASDNSIGEPVVGGSPVASAGDYENAIELGWNSSTGSQIQYCSIGYSRRGVEVGASLDAPIFCNKIYEAALSGIRGWTAETAAISVDLANNLIISVEGTGIGVNGGLNGEIDVYNNTVEGCLLGVEIEAVPGDLTLVSNLLTNCVTGISAQTDQVSNDYNGYFNNGTNVYGVNAGANVVTLAESPYEGGEGWYFIDQNCDLINGGAWSAESAGLSGFFTNFSDYPRETDDGAVDIGYHYPTFDADNDDMPDEWEDLYDLDPYSSSDASWDTDTDDYTNITEYRGGSDPTDEGSVPRRYLVKGGDFDGDGDMDTAVVRIASNSIRYWYISGVGTWNWGYDHDFVVPGDFDGDGTTDLTTWRPAISKWIIKDQSPIAWGTSNDCFLPADYDGDGTDDCTTWRPKIGRWLILGVSRFYLGDNDDIPVPGEYSGDGTVLAGVWNPSDGEWDIHNLTTFYWGDEDDLPFAADMDGDGTDDYVCFSPETGTSSGLKWNIRYADDSTQTIYYGNWGDIPAPGDYDADGTDEIRVFRPSDGTWYTYNGSDFQYGATEDQPLSGYLRGLDSDFDGLPDDWEEFYFGNLNQDPQNDHPDYDDVDNITEYKYGSSPLLTDTDGDGLTDYEEIETYGTDPTLVDTDGDSFSDADEVADGSDPLDETDGPGMLINPGFELWDGAFSSATGWVWSETSSQWSASTDNPYQGSYSGAINREASSQGTLYQYGMSMTEDVEYFVAAMVRGTGQIRIGVKYPGSTYSNYGDWNILTAAAWTLIEHSKTSGSTGADGGIKIQVCNCADGGIEVDNAYFDDEPPVPLPTPVPGVSGSIVINEIGWAGTEASSSDEYIELFNTTTDTVNVDGWVLSSSSDDPEITLSGSISGSSYYLLERTDNTTISDVSADVIYVGGLSNDGESLELRDATDQLIDQVTVSGEEWPAGVASPYYSSMERINPQMSGTLEDNWRSNDGYLRNGQDADSNALNATIKSLNSAFYPSAPTNLDLDAGDGFVDMTWDAAEAGRYELDGYVVFRKEGAFAWQTLNEDPLEGTTFTDFTVTNGNQYSYYLRSIDSESNFSIGTSNIDIVTPGPPPQLGDNIIISEVMFDPIGTEPDNEWIELFNPTSSSITIDGWQIADTGATFTFPTTSTLSIGASEYLVLGASSEAAGGNVAVVYNNQSTSDGTIQLSNSGDTIYLKDETEEIIDQVTYSSNWIREEGSSITRKAVRRSSNFVEIYNKSDHAVDLAGLRIFDGAEQDNIEPYLTDESILESGAYALIVNSQFYHNYYYQIDPDILLVTCGDLTIGNGLSPTDDLIFYDLDSSIIDTFTTFTDIEAPADNTSVERIDPEEGDSEDNWGYSTDGSGSTPGTENSLTP